MATGFEIAGVILGAIPIVCKVAQSYKEGFAPVGRWLNHEADFIKFLNQVQLQRAMFYGSCELLLQYAALDPSRRAVLLSGKDVDQWRDEAVVLALKQSFHRYYSLCVKLLQAMVEDLSSMQEVLCLKDGKARGIFAVSLKYY